MRKMMPKPIHEKKYWWKFWVGVLIGLLIGGVAWYVWWWKTPPKEVEVEKPVVQEVVKEVPQVVPEEPCKVVYIDDWKTYENAEHGYTLQYPANWTVDEATDPSPSGEVPDEVFFRNPNGKFVLAVGVAEEDSDALLTGRTGVGAGDFEAGPSGCAGNTEIDVVNLSYGGKVKEVFFGGEPVNLFELDGYKGTATFLSQIPDAAEYDALDVTGMAELTIAKLILGTLEVGK